MDPERASWTRMARRLIRANDRAVLATARAGDGWPSASFVLAACDHRAAPLPLPSDLAEHGGNLVHESRASLLFDGAAGLDRPPAGARVTVIGRLEVCTDGVSAARFVRRHPDAGRYASFADFNLFRMSVQSAHPVAGFGVVRRLDAAEILPDAGAAAEFGDAEAAIVERVNRDHAEDMARRGAAQPGLSGPGWSMTGVDPEGCDLRRGGDAARLDFDRPAADAAAAKAALARLFQAARSRARRPGGRLQERRRRVYVAYRRAGNRQAGHPPGMEEDVKQTGTVIGEFGLDNHGLANLKAAHWNCAIPTLYEHALRRGEGVLAAGGALVTETGEYTGRSPKDKFIVDEASTSGDIWWGPVNQKISPEHFDIVRKRMLAYFQGREVFVQDVFAGAEPAYRLRVRIVTQQAWHSLFARNMFIAPSDDARRDFEPEFTILHAPGMRAVPEIDGTRSEVFVLLDLAKRLVLVGGSHYTGEIKKTIFSVLNYLLPARGVLPMHCSANIGAGGDTAIFFGLSGTGKTTLSADATRTLIGDDEHGWSDNGVFNFEGGCYAKAIQLSAAAEPEIHAACFRFGTVLENVVLRDGSRLPDFDDESLTENTRASYPLSFLANVSEDGMGGHPENIVMLTADAFGVLPPISRLSAEQAMYHFLSGYTARVAGTERGLGSEPEATFSTCFGAPFLPRRPTVYAKLLGERIARHGATCWLVNTGWSGGGYGVGKRMKIAHTRAMLRAALEGKLAAVASAPDPNFGMLVPSSCPDIPDEVLHPRNTWSDKSGYDQTARNLARRFEKNFEQFEPAVDDDVKAAAIRAAA